MRRQILLGALILAALAFCALLLLYLAPQTPPPPPRSMTLKTTGVCGILYEMTVDDEETVVQLRRAIDANPKKRVSGLSPTAMSFILRFDTGEELGFTEGADGLFYFRTKKGGRTWEGQFSPELWRLLVPLMRRCLDEALASKGVAAPLAAPRNREEHDCLSVRWRIDAAEARIEGRPAPPSPPPFRER